MTNDAAISDEHSIRSKILIIRGQQVMLDRDLADLYGVETKVLNQAVKRNIERFPEEFCFRLTKEEVDSQIFSRSQIVTLKKDKTEDKRGTNIKYLPYVFTEQGVAMLSSVLKSNTAIKASIQIMNAFVSMRHFLLNNAEIFVELKSMRQHQIETDLHLKESDKKIDKLFTLMDKYNVKDEQGIYFQGQIFDAYAKFESFLSQATKEIILIDNYVDLSVLQRLAKKKKGVNIVIYTDPKTKLTQQDIQAFNAQYPTLTLNYTTKTHDRFLIIDNSILYHIGASLKDLGKKNFAFGVLEPFLIQDLLRHL